VKSEGGSVKQGDLWLASMLAFITMVVAITANAGQQMVTVDTRPGVTVRVLLMTPETAAKGTLVIFPGGNGAGHLTDPQGKIRLSGNFLVRSAGLFVHQGLVAAIVDVPSDHANGMDFLFRSSQEHVEDIKKVLDGLGEKLAKPIVLIGTSAGTISVGSFGTSQKDPRLAGMILTASIGASRGRGGSLVDFPLEKMAGPVLFVHHKQDACWASPFKGALKIRDRVAKSAKTDFIEVMGGDPPISQPCEAKSTHGFLGKEREVVSAIADWIAGRPIPDTIGP